MFSEHLLLRTPLDGCFCLLLTLGRISQLDLVCIFSVDSICFCSKIFKMESILLAFSLFISRCFSKTKQKFKTGIWAILFLFSHFLYHAKNLFEILSGLIFIIDAIDLKFHFIWLSTDKQAMSAMCIKIYFKATC